MSLYYDAATILTSSEQKGSLKSLVYAKNSKFKSKPAHMYALISETAKYDTFLKEVVENAGILAVEPKLTPILSILLVHDHLFAKNGIAAASTHPLRQIIEKHKTRLQSESTRARLRRRVANIDDLKAYLVSEKGKVGRLSPRWARVNTAQTSLAKLMQQSYASFQELGSIQQLAEAGLGQETFHIDEDVPGLIAFHPDKDLTKTQAYLNGDIILQDKASCFPAYLLLGNATSTETKDIVDGCAAPGNKTTHAAAIVKENKLTRSNVYACERDAIRSKTLQMMVDKAGVGRLVTVLPKQDFLALDPDDERFSNVTHLLLDPSCSGSGILGREDVPILDLPANPRQKGATTTTNQITGSKKRKREAEPQAITSMKSRAEVENGSNSVEQLDSTDRSRLEKLSSLQSLIIEHAFRFPNAIRVTYSTCSIHTEENECVVERVLRSEVGRSRGWRVLKRTEQVEGMKRWKTRGVAATHDGEEMKHALTEEEVEACIRCYPHDEQGTMGFFVCGFVRDVPVNGDEDRDQKEKQKDKCSDAVSQDDDDEGEWEGFSDD